MSRPYGTCAYCVKEFYKAGGPGAKYCSEECKKLAEKERGRKRKKSKWTVDRLIQIGWKPKCEICNYDVIHALTVSHKAPLESGGSDDLENTELLCSNCHRLRHPANFERRFGVRLPVKLIGGMCKGWYPSEPNSKIKCFLCEQIYPHYVIEVHHIVPKALGGKYLSSENLMLICANCHAIITRTRKILKNWLKDFLTSEHNPYPRISTIDRLKALSIAMQHSIRKEFAIYLSDKWDRYLM